MASTDRRLRIRADRLGGRALIQICIRSRASTQGSRHETRVWPRELLVELANLIHVRIRLVASQASAGGTYAGRRSSMRSAIDGTTWDGTNG